ncbi:MAG TPA: class I SAM-dependent methyltransferase [Capillimicrobium sp.]|nr:class I SAM-dependent methyltransferase [Capillimicrobium sp.]
MIGAAARARMRRTRERAAWRAYHVLRRAARPAGYHLVRAGYYSPIPELGELPPSAWDEPSPMPGLPLDLDAQVAMLKGDLGPFLAEFRPPRHAPGDAEGYHFDNPFYGPLDAAVLYAIVRRHRPRRVLEIGAGFSSLVIAGAAARNAAEGSPVEHRVVDPYPSPLLQRLGARVSVRAQEATDVPLDEFAALEAGDVLFIDTTHTVRIANDVLYLLLQAIPAVAPGVVVHVHDVFRPYEYPRELYETFGVYWQEHYLLQALLAYNERFEVVCANHALYRDRREAVRALVPSVDEVAHAPSAFWFRRTETGA